MTAKARQDFAVPPATGTYDGIDLALLDRDDEDERRILIEAEHPGLHQALRNDLDEVHIDGTTVNPRLHIAFHAVVANQLWADDPPEVWTTAQRLTTAGYDRHEVLHMLASVSSEALYEALRTKTPVDRSQLATALAALPESWERERPSGAHDQPANRAERRAAHKHSR